MPLLFLTTTSLIKNIPGTIVNPEGSLSVLLEIFTLVVPFEINSFNFNPSAFLMKTEGMVISFSSSSDPLIIVTKSSVQSEAPVSLLYIITAFAPAFWPFKTFLKKAPLFSEPPQSPLSINKMFPLASEVLDIVLHPSSGFDKITFPVILEDESSGGFGPKDATMNSIGFSSLWETISIVLLLLIKTWSESDAPPKIFFHVIPPSLDFHNPLPIASPPV